MIFKSKNKNRITSSSRKVHSYTNTKPRELQKDSQLKRNTNFNLNERKNRSKNALIGLLIAVVVLLLSFNLRYANVDLINSTNLTKDSKEYSSYANELLNSSVLNLSKFTFNAEDIEEKLTQKFPEIQNLEVSNYPFTLRPKIKISFEEAKFLLMSTNNSYVLNNQGQLIGEKNKFENLDVTKLIQINDQSGVEVVDGYLLTEIESEAITNIQMYLTSINEKISQITIPQIPREVLVSLEGKNYSLKFSSYEPIREQVGSYKALMETLEKQSINPVEYIDLRIPERVYYK